MEKDLHEPPPQPSRHPAIQPMVVDELHHVGYHQMAKDIEERAEFGKVKYGTLLKPHNGRNALNDLYQEVLDAIVYARQAAYEKNDAISNDLYQKLISIAEITRIRRDHAQASQQAIPQGTAQLPPTRGDSVPPG
jgi:hypothetical protein